MAIKCNNVNDRRVKHGKPISGVRRNFYSDYDFEIREHVRIYRNW